VLVTTTQWRFKQIYELKTKTKMGRVFFDTRKNVHNLTADYTVLASDSNKTFIVLPAATTEITLPAPATAGEGWNCNIILQSDSGFGGDALMDQKVNIDLSAGTANVELSTVVMLVVVIKLFLAMILLLAQLTRLLVIDLIFYAMEQDTM